MWVQSIYVRASDNACRRVRSMKVALIAWALLSFLLVPPAWMGWSLGGTAAAGAPGPSSSGATDEAELVLIPAGEFIMGHNSGYDTLPVHRINMPAFSID